MKTLTIAVAHQAVAADAPPDEQDVLLEVDAVCNALEEAGHHTVIVPLSLQLNQAAQRLQELRPSVVFNLVESLNGSGRFIGLAPLLFEELNLPFTGARSGAMNLSSNKLLAKQWLAANGLPTPQWSEDGSQASAGPWIVKSVWEHASIGMDDSAVVNNVSQLPSQLALKQKRYRGDWFCERYVHGREFNLALLETEQGVKVLSVAEIRFEQFPEGKPHIVGYRAKWDSDSFEYKNTQRCYVNEHQEAALIQRLKELALRCWDVFQLSGYARVDFRVDADEQPWILEVNANPCVSPDAGFAAAAQQSGLSYSQMIGAILDASLMQKSALSSKGKNPFVDENYSAKQLHA